MANLKQWILDTAAGEPIEAIVIGLRGWNNKYGEPGEPYEYPVGKVISWEEAEKFLDYEFSAGYGSPQCHAVWAWTATEVIAIGQYDGSTWPYAIPRHPIDAMPTMEGG